LQDKEAEFQVDLAGQETGFLQTFPSRYKPSVQVQTPSKLGIAPDGQLC
jgi:hypothetical protein